MNNSHSRFFHHFMSRQMPCILLPPSVSSTTPLGPSSLSSVPCPSDDHILNLSASMTKHSPLPSPTKTKVSCLPPQGKETKLYKSVLDCSISPDGTISSNKSETEPETQEKGDKQTDFNSNDVGENVRSQSECKTGNNAEVRDTLEIKCDDEENDDHPVSEIDVDERSEASGENVNHGDFSDSEEDHFKEEIEGKIIKNDDKKSKSLAFGIDRILSFKSTEDKDQKSPTASPSVAPSFPSPESPRVVSSLSVKSDNSAVEEKQDKDENSKQHLHHPNNHLQHHSILSKLKLCPTIGHSSPSNETQKRSPALPYFHHHSYGLYRHHNYNHQHPHHHMNAIINPSSGPVHNNSSSHSVNDCSECIFLRRYCGGTSNGTSSRSNNIPSSSSSSANNVTTNNMQFSSALTTPCGPNSSSLSASFSWMANPSIYDSSAIISPVAGFNPHMPLQPSFGMSTGGYATIHQQCNSGGGGGGRRKRSWSGAVFSNLQRKGLEKRFQIQKYITKPDRRQLAATLGLTDAQVKVWFQNRRMKWRHSKEGKVSSGTGDTVVTTTSSSSPPVSSTTSSKQDGAIKDKKK